MTWRPRGTSFLPFAEVLTEHNEEDKLYRVTLVAPIVDVADNYHEARRRLADRLEATAKELRR